MLVKVRVSEVPTTADPALNPCTAAESKTEINQSLDELIGNFEKDIIIDALKTTRGNKAKAAKLLQTTERIMGYKIQSYHIDFMKYRA